MTKTERYELAKQTLERDFNAGWHEIVSLANDNFEDAMIFVALSLYRGEGITMNEEEAYEWFKRIVKLNPSNGFIWNKMADCHFNGYGVPRNHQEALKYYQLAWENGVADAGTEIGWITAFGDIQDNNEIIAAKWFQRAADNGSARGMYFLGYFYSQGVGGLPLSEKMALKYLREAASLDDYMAIRYLLRKNCYGNNDEFIELRNKLFKMAEMGDDNAQYDLGYAYLYGDGDEMSFGLEHNPAESQRWFELAAHQGNVEAMYELGRNYLYIDNGYKIDVDKGEKYLLQAAENGKEDAYYQLFKLYKRSQFDPLKMKKFNPEKALQYGEKAIEIGGNDFLMFDIAECYFKGEGTEVDYEKAAFYYRKCVNDNLEDINSNLSFLPLAKCCLSFKHPADTDYKEALISLKMALIVSNEKDYCSQQKGEIEYWIAYMFDNGLGVSKNLKEALSHYRKSAEYGYEKSKSEIHHFKKTLFGLKKI